MYNGPTYLGVLDRFVERFGGLLRGVFVDNEATLSEHWVGRAHLAQPRPRTLHAVTALAIVLRNGGTKGPTD